MHLLISCYPWLEVYVPLKQPLIPIRIFAVRNVNAAMVIGCVGQMVYYALNLLWPTVITTFFTTDNIRIGLISSTTGASLAVGEIIVAPFFKKIGHLKYQLLAAAIIITVTTALMSIVDQHKLGAAIALTLIAGCCVGVIEAITIVMVGLVVPPEDIGVTIGFYASIRAITGTIALSIYVSVYSARLPVFLARDVVSYAEAAGLPASSAAQLVAAAVGNGTAAAIDAVPGMNSTILEAVGLGTLAGYQDTFKVVFLATLAFGGLSIISAFFIEDVGQYLNNFVNKTLTNTPKRPDAEKQ